MKHIEIPEHLCYNWREVKMDILIYKISKLWKFKCSELDSWIKSGNSAID